MNELKHAKLSPSAAHRWIPCPGSIKLCEQSPPQKESPYAAEGTEAHKLAEALLKGPMDKAPVDSEMWHFVGEYLDAICEVAGKNEVLVEQKFDLGAIHKDMFGTCDACVFVPETKTLHVFDLKYGKGVVVDPEWNSQQMIYAYGALMSIKSGQEVEKVALTIVQPRAYHPEGTIRTWEINVEILTNWALRVLRPAAHETDKPDAALKVGSHCRFCPAIAICPEQRRNAFAIAKTDFENPVLPEPHVLSPNDIVKVMEVSDIFNAWASSVKAYAQDQMERGIKLPGFKLVKKRALRKWSDESLAESALFEALGEDAFEKKVLSVAKAEKALKKNNMSVEACLDGLVIKPDNGLVMAPESDRRKEIEPPSVMDFLIDNEIFS